MPWLACTDGDDKGLAIELGDKPLLLGRQVDCDMQLKDKSASRHHCRVTLVDKKLLVEDMGSQNGVKRRGKRYRGESFKLMSGNGFQIGDDDFVFTDEDIVDKQEVIDLDGVAEHKTVVNILDDSGDSGYLLSDADREELAQASHKEKMRRTLDPAERREMRKVATKTVWARITKFIRRD